MTDSIPKTSTFRDDIIAGLVVFLVALPLCLGIALASGAPLFSGILSGIIGGIVVGLISGSHTSVSGPAAGLTAIVAAQIGKLGAFETFLLAVMLAGVIQIVMGLVKAGSIAAFFPSSVIKGLLAAIGIIIILKQIPHVVGHDRDPEGEMSFIQQDNENTFSELMVTLSNVQEGAMLVGVISLLILIFWDKIKPLKKSGVPASLVVVIVGVVISLILRKTGSGWAIESSHLVQVPVAKNVGEFFSFLTTPDFSALTKPAVYIAALTIAIVASLETLLNLEAVDKIDPQQRKSPPNRELVAQGVGNVLSGLVGGLPMTSVIVRSSVNINAGGKSKLSAIFHAFLLLGCVALIPGILNEIPLSALAAILIMTGIKLASPKLFKQMWSEGRTQFFPFIITVVAIILSDLMVGILIGLLVSIAFILYSNLRRPLNKTIEKHVGGDVTRIELANQVSFLNRASLQQALNEVGRDQHLLLDARSTDYIDADILDMIRDFQDNTAPAHGVKLSLLGFKDHYGRMVDRISFVDFSSREVQSALTPSTVLRIFQDGNVRFCQGRPLTRDLVRLVDATAAGQFPMAVVLSCIDSRTPAELIFDLGLGDIFSVRVAGNVAARKVLGSMEYACAVAGAKAVFVVGHTCCGAVNAAVDLKASNLLASYATGCANLDGLIGEIQAAFDDSALVGYAEKSPEEKQALANTISKLNVQRTMANVREQSPTLKKMDDDGKLAIIGGLYDISTGKVEFFMADGSPITDPSVLDGANVTS